MISDVRRKGAIKLLIGGTLFAGFFVAIMRHGDFFGIGGGIYSAIGIGAPGALVLIGSIELLLDVPFTTLSAKWNSLSSLRRGILGTAIIIAAIVLLSGTLLLIGWLTHPET